MIKILQEIVEQGKMMKLMIMRFGKKKVNKNNYNSKI